MPTTFALRRGVSREDVSPEAQRVARRGVKPAPQRKSLREFAWLVGAAIVAPVALAARVAAQDPLRLHTAAGAHYDVGSQLGAEDAADRLALLESAWPQLVRFFGREPKLDGGKLRVRVYADERAYLAGMAQAEANPGSGHLATYCSKTRAVYAHAAWGAPWVRRRMVEECIRQFTALLAQHKDKTPAWCAQGVAKHLSMLAWDGKRVELGVVRPIALENDAAVALARIEAKQFDYRKLLGAGAREDEVVHAEAVRVLANDPAYRKKFQALLPRLEKGLKLGEAEWASHFGAYEKFEQALRASARDAQQAFLVGHVEWDTARVDRDPDTRGRVFDLRCAAGLVVSCCHVAAPAQSLHARLELPPDGKRIGVVLDWFGVDDYRVLLFRRDGGFEMQQRTKTGWEQLGGGAALAAGQKFTSHVVDVAAAKDADGAATVRVRLDGKDVVAAKVRNGSFGLAADCGTAIFRDVRIRP